MRTQQPFSKPSPTVHRHINIDRLNRKETADVVSAPAEQTPSLKYRHYHSMGGDVPSNMQQTQKKAARSSNVSSLISDFESLRQNIRSMQKSDQRIVAHIQKSYEDTRFSQGTISMKTALADHQQGVDPEAARQPMNYRYQVQEVHQLQGIDQVYEIRRLEQLSRQLKRKLQEETSQANYYRFQVWMLQDILAKNGIQAVDGSGRFNRSNSALIVPPVTETAAISNSKVALLMKEQLSSFCENVLVERMAEVQSYCCELTQRMDRMVNTVGTELLLKCGYMKNKLKYAGDANLKKKVEQLERELEKKTTEAKTLQQNFNSKSSELQTFRGQVTDMMDKIRADYQQKILELESTVQSRQATNRELQEALRAKIAEAPKKNEELMRSQREIERLGKFVHELTLQLETKDQMLAEQELRLIELKADLQLGEKDKVSASLQIEDLKEQVKEAQQSRRQEESMKLEWPQFQSVVMDNLEKSHILPNVAERESQTTEILVSIIQMDALAKKLEQSQQIIAKLQEDILKLKGDQPTSDRKMYRSVLHSHLDSETSKLGSRLPRNRRSMIREDEPPNRKSTGNSDNGGMPPLSNINAWSKLSGYKQLSLNFSVDDQNPPLAADLDELIGNPDYPFERLRLSGEQAIVLIMKMAQIIRCQRDQLQQKKRHLNFLKSRNDADRQVVAAIPAPRSILQSSEVQLCDYMDSYSQSGGAKILSRPKGNQLEQLQRNSMHAIEKLLEKVESLQTQLEKSERNQNNLIQMKELYKAEISKLNRQNQQYETHYKQEVARMMLMLQDHSQDRNLQAVRQVTGQLIRLTASQQYLVDPQIRQYLNMLAELLQLNLVAVEE